MKINSLILIFVLLINNCFSQITLNGYIKDLENSENVSGAVIYEKNNNFQISSDNNGYFSLTNLSINDTIDIIVSNLGYINYHQKIHISKDTTIEIYISKNTLQIKEVFVFSNQNNNNNNDIGVLSIPISQVKLLPSIGGETDIFKSFFLLPGIQQGSEGSNNLYVRGGSPDQNLILLDDIPLFSVGHVGGLFSVFDPNSIDSYKLYKSGFSSKYGDMLSSVIDIKQKEGNKQKIQRYFDLSLILSKFLIEGPIKKNKSTFLFSVRRSNLDLFQFYYYKLIDKNAELNSYYSFYDINAKLVFPIKEKSKFIINYYSGSDNITISENYIIDRYFGISEKSSTKTTWGNYLISFRLNSNISNKLLQNTTLAFTKYKYSIKAENIIKKIKNDSIIEKNSNQYLSAINNFILKTDWEYLVSTKNQINFGIDNSFKIFEPIVSTTIKNGEIETKNIKINSVTTAFYIEYIYTFNKNITFFTGFRPELNILDDTSFFKLIPRVLISYNFKNNFSLKFAYDKTNQNIHLLANNSSGLPTDLWVPATKKAIPENANQYTLEFIYNNKKFSFITDIYYKKSNNLIEYKDGAYFFGNNSNWENNIETNGIGYSKGIEFLLKKETGKITGWISYTLSKTTRIFESLNNGKEFFFKYDRTHNFSIVSIFEIKKNLILSASWVFMTGNVVNLATTSYYSYTNDLVYDKMIIVETSYNENKNSFRLPNYHRLDISIKYQNENKTFSFDIFNLYSRSNVYFIYAAYPKNDYTHIGKKKFYILSLFPIIPSVSYSIKF